MKRFRSRYARRVLVPVMAASLLSACGKWTVQEMAPSQVVTEKQPGRVRLTMLDGDKMELFDPKVSNGEIVGQTRGEIVVPTREGYSRVTTRQAVTGSVRVAADSVDCIELREPDAITTVVGVVAGLAVVGAVAFVVALMRMNAAPS